MVASRLARSVGQLLDRERPVAVLGTGGYASAPVVWFAGRRGIPTAIQEQNAYPGLATRLLSGRVRHVYLGASRRRGRISGSGPTTRSSTPAIPIAPPDPSAARRPRAVGSGCRGDRPVVLVTGGSQGAAGDQPRPSPGGSAGGWRGDICGPLGDGTGHLRRVRQAHHRPRPCRSFDFLDPMADAYAVADLVVSRAGMMTVAELCAWGLPSVLIPLPTAAADHQTQNARVLADAGAPRDAPAARADRRPASAHAVGGLLRDRTAAQGDGRAALARGADRPPPRTLCRIF